ncbi:MAG TPA: hypothetical protein VNW15_06590 [Rhizomicrobium sp.]|nr:hypothetical protein [Rhizomicrobium sp.]
MRSGKSTQQIALLAALTLFAVLPAVVQAAGPAKPIPKAGNWMLTDELPTARGCAATVDGDNVDVHLLETNDGHMLLVAARPDWNFKPGPVKFRFQVDAGPDKPMDGDGVANLLVTPVDAPLETALLSAKEVTWRVPGAEYHAKVTGLKIAFAALKACNIRKGVKH